MSNTAEELVVKGPRIRKDMLEKVEAYKAMHSQYKKLEREMKRLREEIEPYMLERGIPEIVDDLGQGVVLEERRMPMMSTRYTSYDIDDLVMVLDPKVVSDCIVEVIDKDLVEAKVLMGEIPQEISELKKYKLTNCFIVK